MLFTKWSKDGQYNTAPHVLFEDALLDTHMTKVNKSFIFGYWQPPDLQEVTQKLLKKGALSLQFDSIEWSFAQNTMTDSESEDGISRGPS
jgi:hypothetical protein